MGTLPAESTGSATPRRRRSRNTKQNQSSPASTSGSELRRDESSSSSTNCAAASSDLGSSASPTMHIDQATVHGTVQNQQPIEIDNSMLSNISPEPAVTIVPVRSVLNVRPINFQARPKLFHSYWPAEAVNEALEKGQLLKALFRVNAYNKNEAYCKIDGVQADVLINGLDTQNRAIEGDTVAITIDHPSLWPKMKGLVDTSNNNGSQQQEAITQADDCSRGKSKVDDHVSSITSADFVEKVIFDECGSSSRAVLDSRRDTNELSHNRDIYGYHASASDSTMSCSSHVYENVNSVENLSAVVSLLPSKRPTGRVVAIMESSLRRENIVGFLSVRQWISSRESKRKDGKKNKNQSDANHGYVLLTPTDPKFTKMMVPIRNLPGSIMKRLESGDLTVEADLVAAQIIDWAEDSHIPEARVTQTFGRGSDVEAQIAAILFENAIDASEFSPDVVSCLPHTPWQVPPQELTCRRDLRNLCIFTIDPATATDLDDALSIERMSDGVFRVGVHIADVSYFVLPDTPLDIDAQIRSTSVYLLQRKLPMLPEMLSENLASLNPGVDRLAFSIIWDINPSGAVIDRWIGRTIIRSCIKLSYGHAQYIIDGSSEQDLNNMGDQWPPLYGQFEWSDVIRSVKSLHEVSLKLKESRFKDGALSLESPKAVFLFDEEGLPYDSTISGRIDSNFLVEEFMLLANSTAAEVITRAYPSSALLRRHPEPNARKLREFESFCKKHGLKLDISSSSNLHQSLELIKRELKNDSILFDILMSYAARPMQLASYFCSGDSNDANSDRGHYALAVPLYTHFTSPLRRYPDIVVHRTLAATVEAEGIYLKDKHMLRNKAKGEVSYRCFTGIHCHQDAIESASAQKALSISASKHSVPRSETLVDVAAHCNQKKLATRHVRDATEKLCMWVLLKRKEILYSEARVLGLGPKFMSVYVSKLATERRIYYDEVEGLRAEWLEATSTLILSHTAHKRSHRKSPGKSNFKMLDEVALVVNPVDLESDRDMSEHCEDSSNMIVAEPAVLPVTVHLLSTVPVVLHAVGGDNGPLDIVARLYLSSYYY